jgi:hypothetical protein
LRKALEIRQGPARTDRDHPAQRHVGRQGTGANHRRRGFTDGEDIDGSCVVKLCTNVRVGERALDESSRVHGIDRRAKNSEQVLSKG